MRRLLDLPLTTRTPHCLRAVPRPLQTQRARERTLNGAAELARQAVGRRHPVLARSFESVTQNELAGAKMELKPVHRRVIALDVQQAKC